MSEPSSHTSLLGKIAEYTEVLAANPASSVFVQLADAYRQMGLVEDALQVARAGVSKSPQYSLGFSILGSILVQCGKNDEGAEAFEHALTLNPNELNALRGLSRLLWQRGEQESSTHLINRILSIKPGDPMAMEMLSRLRGKEDSGPPVSATAVPSPGQSKIASPVSLSTRQSRPQAEPISTATIAEIYIRQGYHRRAMRVYRDILHVDPQNQEVRKKLIELKKEVETREKNVNVQRAAERVEDAPASMKADSPNKVPMATPLNPPPAASSLLGLHKQLDQYHGWLKAIEKRRGRVS